MMIRDTTLTLRRPRPRTLPRAQYRHRLGDTATQIVGTGSAIAGTAISTTAALASSSVGLITLSSTMAAAIPVAGAVLAVGVLVFSLLHNTRGLQQDAETTNVVDKAQAYMDQNLAAWNTSNKSLSTQAQALKNWDDCWNAVLNFCGQASEGSPGQRCISERQRGGIYDYFAATRDPIANDPDAGAIDRAAAAEVAANVASALAAAAPGAQVSLDRTTGTVTTTPPADLSWIVPAALLLIGVALL